MILEKNTDLLLKKDRTENVRPGLKRVLFMEEANWWQKSRDLWLIACIFHHLETEICLLNHSFSWFNV